jgi:transposase-like protein
MAGNGNGRTEYSDEIKAACMAALIAGQSIAEIAREYNIPEGTVACWRSRANGSVASVASPETKTAIGDLLLDYLRTALVSLKAQAVVASDPAWLMKQPASELAVLHGVMTDKAVRLLDALQRQDA